MICIYRGGWLKKIFSLVKNVSPWPCWWKWIKAAQAAEFLCADFVAVVMRITLALFVRSFTRRIE